MVKWFNSNNTVIYCFLLCLAALFLESCLTHQTAKQVNTGWTETNEPVEGAMALHKAIASITSSSQFNNSNVGIIIIDLNNSQVLFEQNSGKLFHPASTMKIYTTAAALTYLGAAHRFSTRVAILPNTIQGSVVNGDLWLIGGGDPTLTDSNLMKLAKALQKLGITRINGDIICDDSAFDDIRYGKGWMWDDQPYKDFAPIGALSVNRNTIKVFVSPGDAIESPAKFRLEPPTDYLQVINTAITSAKQPLPNKQNKLTVLRRWQSLENIIDITGVIAQRAQELEFTRNIVFPAKFTGTLYKEALLKIGITFQGTILRGKTPEESQVVADHTSEPLEKIIIDMNKNSHNLDAEILLKTIGQTVKGEQGSAEKGLEAIAEFLANNGISLETTRFADGSGVSRYNLVTPAKLAELLTAINNTPKIRHDLITSLPISGVDGNLKNRMTNSAATAKVSAKTGAMTGVSSLAGYTQSLDGTPLAFVIMMEHYIGPHHPFRLAQDQICAILCQFTQK